MSVMIVQYFFFSSRRRHTRFDCDWSSDVCSSDLGSERYATYAWLSGMSPGGRLRRGHVLRPPQHHPGRLAAGGRRALGGPRRSEERRVGKECRSRWSPDHLKKKKVESSGAVVYIG